MHNDNEVGDALEEVHRIHPVVDRLRDALASLTALDIRATSKGYWSDGREEDERAISSP